MYFGACAPTAPPAPPSIPTPPAKYRRYADAGLQDTYARIVAALQAIKVPVYGPVVNDAQADAIAMQVIEAMRAAPQSAEMQERIKCALIPAIASVGTPILTGVAALGMLAVVGYTVYRVNRGS